MAADGVIDSRLPIYEIIVAFPDTRWRGKETSVHGILFARRAEWRCCGSGLDDTPKRNLWFSVTSTMVLESSSGGVTCTASCSALGYLDDVRGMFGHQSLTGKAGFG